MAFSSFINWVPDLTAAIDPHTLTVPPETRLGDAIALISQAHHPPEWLLREMDEEYATAPMLESHPSPRNSCMLIVQGKELLGILTERDIVRLTAQVVDLQNVTVAEVMIQPVITLSRQAVQDIFAVLFLFRRYRIRHLPIVDEQEHLVGVISHASILQLLRPANLLRFRRVADVMTRQVIQAPLHAPVLQLAQLMADHRVSCVVITQRNEEDNLDPVGIVTERDIVQFQALQMNLLTTPAEAVMSTPLFLLSPEDSLWTAHQEMQKRRVGRLVVSWNWGMGMGIVTQTSLLRVFDPMELYGVIENLQTMMASGELTRSPLTSAENSPENLRDPVRALVLSQLQTVQQGLESLLHPPPLPPAAQRSRLKAILNILEQMRQTIAANPP